MSRDKKIVKIAPSILSADFSCLGKEIKRMERAGADLIHIDVMDGHFVPNLTIGPQVVKDIRKVTKLPLDVHLMIENPECFVDHFIDAGSNMITVHVETTNKTVIKKLKTKLNSSAVKFGLSLNPSTPLEKIKDVINFSDFILVMSVNPGFGGQAFIPKAIDKIKQLRSIYGKDISVDGGINEETAKQVLAAGANILAAGSYIFKAKNAYKAIERIRNAGRK